MREARQQGLLLFVEPEPAADGGTVDGAESVEDEEPLANEEPVAEGEAEGRRTAPLQDPPSGTGG
jgi:hypothetical protein